MITSYDHQVLVVGLVHTSYSSFAMFTVVVAVWSDQRREVVWCSSGVRKHTLSVGGNGMFGSRCPQLLYTAI